MAMDWRARCCLKVTEGAFDVCAYEPNPWGVFDTAGNVAEWVVDWYLGDEYRRRHQVQFPAKDPVVTSGGTERVVRGGHWWSTSEQVMSSARDKVPPGTASPNVGFRTAWRPSSYR